MKRKHTFASWFCCPGQHKINGSNKTKLPLSSHLVEINMTDSPALCLQWQPCQQETVVPPQQQNSSKLNSMSKLTQKQQLFSCVLTKQFKLLYNYMKGLNQSLVGAISNVTDKINPITKRNYTIPLACFVDANWDNNPRQQVHRWLNAYGLGGGMGVVGIVVDHFLHCVSYNLWIYWILYCLIYYTYVQ